MNKTFTVLNPSFKCLFTLFICLITLQGWSQQNLYVDSAATGANNGSSWADAYAQLRTALTAAASIGGPVHIHVAKGTYYPTGNQSTARKEAFTLVRDNIKLYGGYPTGGGVRDIAINPVYLDGNIDNAVPTTGNSYHVMVIAGVTLVDSLIIDGFTFRNGYARGEDYSFYNGIEIEDVTGGALVIWQNSNGQKIRVLNCHFINNWARNGGAVATNQSDVFLENCVFTGNGASRTGGAIVQDGGKITLSKSRFIGNSSPKGGAVSSINGETVIAGTYFETNSSEFGGAIYNRENTFSAVSATQFNNNTASVAGGAIFQERGNTLITGSGFTHNQAQYGGAVRSQYTHALMVKKSIFNGNTSTNTGAALSLAEGIDTLVNNLFIRNKDNSAVGGGAICLFGGNFSVINNTFYADTTTAGRGGAIRLEGSGGAAKLQNNIFYKCQAASGNDVHNDAGMSYSGMNNSFSIDPAFVGETSPIGADNTWGTADDGLVLGNSSPVANGGNTTGINNSLPSTDLAGNPRIMGGTIDMGAYESPVAAPHVLYVDSTYGSDGNSGGSWAFPHKTLAQALTVAHTLGSTVDSIHVAKGTYFPTGTQGSNDRDSAFTILRAGIKLYGGYPAGGGARDLVANQVYLDGNINNPADSTDNSYHVLLIVEARSGADSVVVDGFTICNGNANNLSQGKLYKGIDVLKHTGGGIFITFTAPFSNMRFSNCHVTQNTADWHGGGIYNINSSPSMTHCSFIGNKADGDGGGLYNSTASPLMDSCIIAGNMAQNGAGMCNANTSGPIVRNSRFIGNTAPVFGGGMNNRGNSNPVLEGNEFTGNKAKSGGALYGLYATIPITRCRFEGNVATEGGGALFHTGGLFMINKSVFIGNSAQYGGAIRNDQINTLSVKNSVFVSNTSTNTGAALSLFQGSDTLVNNAFIRNKDNSTTGGGAICAANGNFHIINNTFYADSSNGRGGAIRLETPFGYCNLYNNIFYKCYAGAADNDVHNVNGLPLNQAHNSYSTDPRFVRENDPDGTDNTWGTTDDGLILSESTTLANTGDMAGLEAVMPSEDLAGNPRIFGGGIDPGAYESPVSSELYVDSTHGNDVNTGATWATAYKTLARALQVANGTGNTVKAIHVAKGTYFPTGAQSGTDRDSAFALLRPGITLYGGYPAGGGVRDAVANPVYLDGNINNPADSADNSYHVLVIIGFGSTATDSLVMDGFTIRNGNADGTGAKVYKGMNLERNTGGGVITVAANFSRLSNCHIMRNTARVGGGMYNLSSSPYISNGSFTGNRALVDGGAIYNVSSSSPVIRNSLFSGNTANYGAGIYNINISDPVVRNCRFAQNKAERDGGGMYNNLSSSPLIDSCTFSENRAATGGGMYNNNSSNPVIRNSHFTANTVLNEGGGIYNLRSSSPRIDSCIIADNRGAYGVGIYNRDFSNPIIRNSFIIRNAATMNGGGMINALSSAPLIENCHIQENTANYGAGIFNTDTSKAVIRNCQFTKNTASLDGGGLLIAYSSPLIDSCLFLENTARFGAGIYIIQSSSPVITNSQFKKGTGGADGGGIFAKDNSQPVVQKCEFTENTAQRGGAVGGNFATIRITACLFERNQVIFGGGALFQQGGHFVVNTSKFSANIAQYGGAIRNEWNHQLSVRNSVFELNKSTNTGGAMSLFQGTDTLANNVFVRNKDNSSAGGGALCLANGDFLVTNNTFYADTTTNGRGGAIRLETNGIHASIYNNIFYKCHAGAADNDVYNANGMPVDQSHNSYSISPGFMDENDLDGGDNTWGTVDDGLSLDMCSPVVNAGNNAYIAAGTITDITGRPRTWFPTVDLGAYEATSGFTLNEESTTLTADGNCTNDGWINYYNDSEFKLLVAIKPGANALGSITATSKLRTGYGSDTTAMLTTPFGNADNFHPFNRSWTVTTTNAPVDSVGVRFYFGAADSSDVRGAALFNRLRDLVLYKVNGADAWNPAATGYIGYKYAEAASKTTYTLGSFQGMHYAEFYVTSFSSGSMAALPLAALPLDLLSFTGRLTNDKTKLQWLTSSEINVAHFEVERSTNNGWVKIGQVAARNMAGNQQYEFWDNNPASGMNHYRLKMVDIDGDSKYSKVITVRTNGSSLHVYPNPNNGQFTVEINNAGRSASLQLFDASGKTVHRQRIVQGINRINVTNLSGGIYVLRVEDGLKSYRERLIITK